jgi:uncharacterized protein
VDPPVLAEGQLPESYGTGRLLLAARDAHCLYAHWDATAEQQRQCDTLSPQHRLRVRVHSDTVTGPAVSELQAVPKSRHWFVHVAQAGKSYATELGYYQPDGQWRRLAASAAATTPPDAVAGDKTVRFATLSPAEPITKPSEWTPAQARALAEAIAPSLGPQQSGSAEVAQPSPHQPEQGVPPLVAEFGWSVPLSEAEGISSPAGGEAPAQQGFWLNVGAELVIFGATEADAQVTIAGQPIALRPDGTFSFRFALPDGNHGLVITAVSSQGEVRQAGLEFVRRTRYQT